MSPAGPVPLVDTRPLFRPLHAELMRLLRSLGADDWARPATAAWTVKDVAAHILDGDLRRLSFQRDGLEPAAGPKGPDFENMLDFLNRLNAEWIAAARRLSPRVVADLLEASGPGFADLMESLDPAGRAFFEVTWAGERQGEAWLDIARDYTEKWHHQQQIRLAVGAALLVEPRWLRPVLEVSVLALPRVYAAVPAPPGASVSLRVAGDAGGEWGLVRGEASWTVHPGPASGPLATIEVDQDPAWRLFFKMLSPDEALRCVRWSGDPALGRAFLESRAVMA